MISNLLTDFGRLFCTESLDDKGLSIKKKGMIIAFDISLSQCILSKEEVVEGMHLLGGVVYDELDSVGLSQYGTVASVSIHIGFLNVHHVFFRCDVARVVLRKIVVGGILDWSGELFLSPPRIGMLGSYPFRLSSRLKSTFRRFFYVACGGFGGF
ncbi:hypothetical protein Tco_1447211 [Tanacetum coccineum]